MLYTVDKIGADFELSMEGDLKIDNLGRLIYSQSEDTLRSSLIRRISTTPLGYARYVHTSTESKVLNEDYGSTANLRIGDSYPNMEELESIAIDTAAKDTRIENVSAFFDQNNSRYSNGAVALELVYSIKPEYSSIYSANLPVNEQSLSLMF